MKASKLLILTVAISVLGAGAVAAGSPWGDFKGNPVVKVQVNEVELAAGDVPAFTIDGQTVVPVDQLGPALQALVRYDAENNVVDVYKPNVHMLVGKEVDKNGSVKQSFGKVLKGDKVTFVVFAQVDNLLTGIHAFKIEIADPNGATVASSDTTVLQQETDSFWYPWPFEVTFNTYGKYHVKFLMQLTEDAPFTVVSEKVINAE